MSLEFISKKELKKQVRDFNFQKSGRLQANQTIGIYNNLPWWKKIFVFKLEPKCHHEEGYHCCCFNEEDYK